MEEIMKSDRESILQLIDTSFLDFKEGEIIKGKVIRVTDRDVVVDVGFKFDTIISIEEFDNPSVLKAGEFIEVFVDKVEGREGIIRLSKSKADSLKMWKVLSDIHENNISIEGKVSKSIKGGFMVNIKGVEAFLPGSQIDTDENEQSHMVGKIMNFKVIKLDKIKNNVVVSRKAARDEELDKKRKELWEKVEEGAVTEGLVKKITDFGVFVDIGGVSGLVHISDLSWGKVNHPSEVVQENEKVNVKILRIDKEKGHIALGIKQLTPYPWDNIESRYPANSQIKGKVISITDYGAFIELEPGIEGLLHISEMSWGHVTAPSQLLAVGDTISAIILNVNKEEEKISLSLRQLQPNPWEKVNDEYPLDSLVSGTVKSFSRFGAFVDLKDGITGFLPLANFSWTERIEHASDILTRGKKVKCKVISIEPEKQRIILGIKQLTPDPLLTVNGLVGESFKCKIKEVVEKGIVVKFEVDKQKIEGFLPASHLAKTSKKWQEKYEAGDDMELILVEVDAEKRKIILSETGKVVKEKEEKEPEEETKE
ncbi:MAG: 30S ribosomal protein S1 [bacterium]